MKVSDYMVQFLEEKGIRDVFGIPGVGCGHFMDSMIGSPIRSHLVYHEQAAAFAAGAYAQAMHNAGFAYTTAGPGGTNLITGIANAYCDSIPVVFMVGEKDLKSLRGSYHMRQKTSQEVDIVGIASPITKWSYQVTAPEDIRYVLEKAFYLAESGRPGPVLLDIPSDIARADVDVEGLTHFETPEPKNIQESIELTVAKLQKSEKPLLLIGNGVKQARLAEDIMEIAKRLNIPIVTTLLCADLFCGDPQCLGYIGIDGDSAANRAVRECDLLISLGARLNFKQVTEKRTGFAAGATIIRVDCEPEELEYKVRDEIGICADVKQFIPELNRVLEEMAPYGQAWADKCQAYLKDNRRKGSLNPTGDRFMRVISELIPENTEITVDTGSHRRWLMSQFKFKKGQRLYQSAGLASMGYALPAAVGVYYASQKPVICIDGDGGIMMNLQELQLICREQLPITVIVFNNHCLGDIMEFQKKIFDKRYFTTTEDSGYQAADFRRLAEAFHMDYQLILSPEETETIRPVTGRPQLIEVVVPSNV